MLEWGHHRPSGRSKPPDSTRGCAPRGQQVDSDGRPRGAAGGRGECVYAGRNGCGRKLGTVPQALSVSPSRRIGSARIVAAGAAAARHRVCQRIWRPDSHMLDTGRPSPKAARERASRRREGSGLSRCRQGRTCSAHRGCGPRGPVGAGRLQAIADLRRRRLEAATATCPQSP